MMRPVIYEFKVERLGQESGTAVPAMPLHKLSGMLGRGHDCDYVLTDDDRILSRRHAEIKQVNGQVHWTDLGINASQLGGVPLIRGSRQTLRVGDQVHAGPFVLTLQLHQPQSVWDKPTSDSEPAPQFHWLSETHQKEPGIDELLCDEAPLLMPDIQTPWVAMRVPIGQPGEEGYQAVDSNGTDRLQSLFSSIHSALGLTQAFDLDAEHLVQLASLCRSLLGGYQKLLASRHIVRAEMGTSHTVIGPTANNPMKCVASVDALLLQLLQPTQQGFLSAEHSIHGATQDLLDHQRFSTELLKSFSMQLYQALNPSTLETQYAKAGGLDLAFSLQKKARLWDEYCKRFDQLSNSPNSPFSTLLEKTLLELSQAAVKGKQWK